MERGPIIQEFKVSYRYPVFFTNSLFDIENPSLKDTIINSAITFPTRLLFIIDEGVISKNPDLIKDIKNYVSFNSKSLAIAGEILIFPGGEECKNKPELVETIEKAVNDFKIDRHSYIVAVGGGAILDMVGFAAAISHRGVRLIRVPTTVLSQNDSGVGVKNSINAFNKKNFLGTFAPPFAVFNDFNFLTTLDEKNWRAGISEAIKVSLIKDKAFFKYLKENTKGLVSREMEPMEYLIYRCAELHLNHIAGGDPFEKGSSRPLDFGHWSAHKLEQMTNFSVLHGEAVAIGIALDSVYSYLLGMLPKEELDEIITFILDLGFDVYHPLLSSGVDDPEKSHSIFKGLSEFREHLGGKLTIMLLEKIGKGKEVHEVDFSKMREAIKLLEEFQKNK